MRWRCAIASSQSGEEVRLVGRRWAYTWLPCEVKPGPFSDERLVRVASEFGDWVGFVPVSSLEGKEGERLIRALIVEVQGDRFLARIPGESLSSTLSMHALSCLKSVDPIEGGRN